MPRPSQSLHATPHAISRQHRVWLYFHNQNLDDYLLSADQLKATTHLPISAIVLPKSLARTYSQLNISIPLIVHLNGRTVKPLTDQVIAPVVCTVQEAVSLNAQAVVYTIFLGSVHQQVMQTELSAIKKQAARAKLPLIVQPVMAGPSKNNHSHSNMLSYAATTLKSFKADYLCLPTSSDNQPVRIAQAASPSYLIADISQSNSNAELLSQTKQIISSGNAGISIDQTVLDYLDKTTATRLSQLIFGLS